MIGMDCSTSTLAMWKSSSQNPSLSRSQPLRRPQTNGWVPKSCVMRDPARLMHSRSLRQELIEFCVVDESQPRYLAIEAPLREEVLDPKFSLLLDNYGKVPQHFVDEAHMLINWNNEFCDLLHQMFPRTVVVRTHFAVARVVVAQLTGILDPLCRSNGLSSCANGLSKPLTAKETFANKVIDHHKQLGIASTVILDWEKRKQQGDGTWLDEVDAFTISRATEHILTLDDEQIDQLKKDVLIEDEKRLALLNLPHRQTVGGTPILSPWTCPSKNIIEYVH